MSEEEFGQLSVSGDGEIREPFDRWHARVREEIPHVPDCVAEHWLYRHESHTPYTWLPLSRLRFDLQTWDLARVRKIGEGIEPRWCPDWSDALGTDPIHRETWLGQYMLEHGTWPVPIIVLDNAPGICSPDDDPLARWHLIEGHMRSAYLDHLAKTQKAQSHHQVWVTTIVDGPDEAPDNKSCFSPTGGRTYFRSAVRDMATGLDSLQDRIRREYRSLMKLRPAEIPRQQGARSRFIEICRRMGQLSDLSAEAFTGQEARSIAVMIVEIHDVIEQMDREQEAEKLRTTIEHGRAQKRRK